MKNLRDDFGAAGDGMTDDTGAVERAFSAAGSVFVPSGTYRMEAGILITASDLRVRCEDGVSFVYCGPSNPKAALFSFPGTRPHGNVVIRNARFTCETPGSLGYAFAASGAAELQRIVWSECCLDGFFATAIRAANRIDLASILDCEFFNNSCFPGSDDSDSCITGTLTNSDIRGCFFHHTGVASTRNHAVYLNGGARNINVIGNRFVESGCDAVGFGTSTDGFDGRPQNTGLTFSGNTIRGIPHAALRVGCASGVTCSGNVVINAAYCAVLGPRAFGWEVQGNICSSDLPPELLVQSPCICLAVYGASNGAIRGNSAVYTFGFDRFVTANGRGVVVNGCSDIDILDNSVTGYDVGVDVVATTGAGASNSRIRVRGNRIVRLPSAAEPRGSFRPYGVTTGIAVSGLSSDVEVSGNTVVNYATGMFFGNGRQTARGLRLFDNLLRDVTNPIKTDPGTLLELGL